MFTFINFDKRRVKGLWKKIKQFSVVCPIKHIFQPRPRFFAEEGELGSSRNANWTSLLLSL